MITNTLHQEFFERLYPAVRERLPDERKPKEYALGLTAIALAHNVTVEETQTWLRTPGIGKDVSLTSFTRHATEIESYKRELAKAAEPPAQCQQCGCELLRRGPLLVCSICGEAQPA